MTSSGHLTVELLREELRLSREAVLVDFRTELSSLRLELRQEIEAIRSETTTSLHGLRQELGEEVNKLRQSHVQTTTEQTDMSHSLSDAHDRIQQLEQLQESNTKELKRLKEKCFDLESRSRRRNLRFVGIPEGAEGGSPTKFMAELIPEVLGAENFPSPVEIDRAHRSLTQKPKKGQRPRSFIVRLHYYAQKEINVGLAKGKGTLSYRGTPIHIYPDLPVEVSKLRATFNGIKAKHREAKIDYSLFYPAVLTLNLDGVRHTFNSPQAAEEFYQAKISRQRDG